MKPWIKISLILCVIGFLTEFRPNEPYYTHYLLGPRKNFTEEQVNQEILPVVTYSQLLVLVLVFLVTDMLRYKPVIILIGISICAMNILTLVAQDVFTMQAVCFAFGVYLASLVAYYTYIYAKVDKRYYQKVTSHTQVAILLGRLLSSLLGQVLVSTGTMDYHELNYIGITAGCLALLWAFFLPSVKRSMYFHADKKPDNEDHEKEFETILSSNTLPPSRHSFTKKCLTAFRHLWNDFRYAYTNLYVFKWSIWWSLATCGFYQNYLYAQMLWATIISEGSELTSEMSGMVIASYTAIGAVTTFACGWLRFNWEVLGEATLAGCALMQGAALIVASLSTTLLPAYVGYVAFSVLYHPVITIANAEIAKHINEDSYGLVFGVNTFFALFFQTILTVFVIGDGGFALSPRHQFLVYGICFVVLGCVFATVAVVLLCRGKLKNQSLWLPEQEIAAAVVALAK